jgi:hypothetical protein
MGRFCLQRALRASSIERSRSDAGRRGRSESDRVRERHAGEGRQGQISVPGWRARNMARAIPAKIRTTYERIAGEGDDHGAARPAPVSERPPYNLDGCRKLYDAIFKRGQDNWLRTP